MTAIAMILLCGMIALLLDPNANVNAQTTGLINRSFILPNGTTYSLSIDVTNGPNVAKAKIIVQGSCSDLFPPNATMYWYNANTGKEYLDYQNVTTTSDPITVEYRFKFQRPRQHPKPQDGVGVITTTTLAELRTKIKTTVNVTGFNPANITIAGKIISFDGNSGSLTSFGIDIRASPSGTVN